MGRQNPVLGVEISGTGSGLPRTAWTNQELIDLYKIKNTSDEWIRENVGIEQRYICEPEKILSRWLLTLAGKRWRPQVLHRQHGLTKFLATTTSVTYLRVPGAHTAIQNSLVEAGYEIPDSDERNTACTGFMSALLDAYRYFAVDGIDRALVIGSDTLSRLTNYKDRSTGILFADGAGAAVLERTDRGAGLLGWSQGVDGSKESILFCKPRGTIQMEGPKVFEEAVRAMETAGRVAMEMAGVEPEEIELTIPHQANIRIIRVAAKKLRLPMENVVVTINKHANTSSGSIPLAFDEARRAGRIPRNSLLHLNGFGAGITKGAAIVRF